MDELFSSNNATSKLLGYEYQKFMALEACLNSSNNEIVWIECHGDIAYDDKSVEIKHHIDQGNLSDSHKDVWKTIYNLINDHQSLVKFNRYELLTTSKINDKSIFHNWNNKTPENKISDLKKCNITSTIKKYYDKFVDTDYELTKSILSKFYIYGNQPTIDIKLEQLKKHPAFLIIDENYIEAFIERMLGYISNQAINNLDNWHINTNEFKREMAGFAKPFCSTDYPFPKTPKKAINNNQKSNFNFVERMKEINLDEIMINGAIMDYLRSESSTLKILEYHSSMLENLEDYEDDIKSDLDNLKLKYSTELSKENRKPTKKISLSQKIYADGQLLQIKKILGLQPIEGYFQKGRIHAIVDRNEFIWLLK